MDTKQDLKNESFYTPLPEQPSMPQHSTVLNRTLKISIGSLIFLVSLATLLNNQSQKPPNKAPNLSLRGVEQGVSAKSNPFRDASYYNWTDAMFSWQRTAFHFQPEKNWMNDPDGPLYHKGWYHLFYQYNPDSAIWGNITWGHAVSTDLIHWLYLPIAMVPDQWYDINGVWTGSATLLPDGRIVMLYTGDTFDAVQVQNLAYPANLSDPLLLHWVKYSDNPVLVPPTGIGKTDFRDPTTGWIGPNGKWRITIGSKINETGMALVYETTDFTSFSLLENVLHEVPDTGMWECVDFYPVSSNGSTGLDTSVNGFGVKHILKASLDDTKMDVYAIGVYDPVLGIWIPDNPNEDVGTGLRLDYGRFYASKTFYDPVKQRRILWGWINETDTANDDLEKGWASIQTIPRTVLLDTKTGTNILQWPVEEVESLRINSTVFEQLVIEPGSVVSLNISSATQLDIIAEFETVSIGSVVTDETNGEYGCSRGAADRSVLGPFGLLVLADEKLSELTPVFFRPINSTNGNVNTYFCVDESRSSKASDVCKQAYGNSIPVLDNEKLSMRVLVDHSVVESFGQGGRTVISSRIYPTKAIYGDTRLFLFNNATGVSVKATLTIWELNSAFIRSFPLDQI